jgi:lipoate-protein ligase A
MAVKVFFESKQHSELVAVFDSEDLYNVCVKPLEKLAKSWHMELSESVHSEDLDIKPDKFRDVVLQAAKAGLNEKYLSIAAPANSLEEFRGMDSASIFRKLWESSQLNKI